MSVPPPTIEFYEGLSEQLSDVSLRRNRSTGVRTVVLIFTSLQCISEFKSFRNRFAGALRLRDSEGEITVEPQGVKFFFGGPEGDDFERLECRIEINRDDHLERLMRFLERYAEANGMTFGSQQ